MPEQEKTPLLSEASIVDLVNELVKRCDAGVIYVYRPRAPKGEDTYAEAVWGDDVMISGIWRRLDQIVDAELEKLTGESEI